MDDENNKGPYTSFEFPRSLAKKRDEDNKINKLSYFFAFLIWIPLIVTIVKFWWDFLTWLFV